MTRMDPDQLAAGWAWLPSRTAHWAIDVSADRPPGALGFENAIHLPAWHGHEGQYPLGAASYLRCVVFAQGPCGVVCFALVTRCFDSALQ